MGFISDNCNWFGEFQRKKRESVNYIHLPIPLTKINAATKKVTRNVQPEAEATVFKNK